LEPWHTRPLNIHRPSSPDAKFEQEKMTMSRQIEATDGAIDTLVYGLTEEENAVVERRGK
jgi:hypothetical protein